METLFLTRNSLRAWVLTLCLTVSSCLLQAQRSWQVYRPFPDAGLLLSVAYGSNQFVAVGFSGNVVTSPDGQTWTSRFLGTDEDLYDVVYVNGRFVAIGNCSDFSAEGDLGTTVVTSPDGVTWTKLACVQGLSLSRVIVANDLFVALGQNDLYESVIATSSDAISWTERWHSIRSWQPEPALAAGNGIVAVNAPQNDNCGGQSFLVSTNGIQWVEVPTSMSEFCIQNLQLTYGAGKFAALAWAYDPFATPPAVHDMVLLSENGLDWEPVPQDWENPQVSMAPFSGTLNFADGSFVFLASSETSDSDGLGIGTRYLALKSSDGRSWSQEPTGGLEPGLALGQVHAISRLVSANGTFLMVGQQQAGQAGWNGFPYVFVSADGLNWSQRFGSTVYSLTGVAASDQNIIALGSFMLSSLAGRPGIPWDGSILFESTHGAEWQQVHQFDGQFFSGVTYGAGLFILAGDTGLFSSSDGMTWRQATNAGGGWSRMRTSRNQVLAVGQEPGTNGTSQAKAAVTSDGLLWTVQRMDDLSCARDAATDGQTVVVIGDRDCGHGSSVWRGAVGSTWAEVYRDFPSSQPAFVAYGNGMFVIPLPAENTNGSGVLISRDGLSWTKQTPFREDGLGYSLFDGTADLLFANGSFYATDNASGSPEVVASADAVRWKAYAIGFQGRPAGLAAGPKGLFVVASSPYNEVFYSPWDVDFALKIRPTGFGSPSVLQLTGPVGVTVQLQRANQLNLWSHWLSTTLSNGTIQIEDPNAPTASRRFYRAILLP